MSEAQANSGTSSPPRSTQQKPRAALACKRCKRRKQRCDGKHPACRSCERTGSTCLYEKTVLRRFPGGKSSYINALEERIAFLEGRLPDHAEDHFQDKERDRPATVQGEPHTGHAPNPRGCASAGEDASTADSEVADRPSLVDGVAYLSLCAAGSTDLEPHYIGSSSGTTIARIIHSAIYRNHKVHVDKPEVADMNPRTDNTNISPTLLTISEEVVFSFPSIGQARILFDVFFISIHTRWPLLDFEDYRKLFDRQYVPGALTMTERSIFHMIYAITARFLALTRKSSIVDSEYHLRAATESMSSILEQHNLGTVQFLLLLGIHAQRSPYGAGAWSQVRYATSVCIEMGLHRKRPPAQSMEIARDTELRRRAFWCCYSLDRAVGVVLGRAFAIADRDINVELPSTDVAFWSLTHEGALDPSTSLWSNVEPFIHIVKLERIQSRTHRTIFRVDKDIVNGTPLERARLDRKIAAIRADLDTWVQSCPQAPKEGRNTWMYDPESIYLDARDFYGLQYHKAILFLFTIFLPSLNTTDPRFITSSHSAASVCSAYKRLNQNRTLTYTMISLHSCFVAGLTLIYTAWRDRSLFTYEAMEATRACSQSLTIFGEKWPGAVKYRDIFDELSGSLFRTIMTSEPAATHCRSPRLRVSVDMRDAASHHAQSQPSLATGSVITDAMKDAFVEVDEEAPGGWQGWRMWDEMISEDTHGNFASASRSNGMYSGYDDVSWQAYGDTSFGGSDPVQDASLEMASNQWNMHDF